MPKIFSGKQDVYLEVAAWYERYIALGVLKDGDKLPSVRVAAAELGVNPNTVQRAYTHLEERGLVCSLPKKGAYVTYTGADVPAEDGRLKARELAVGIKALGITREDAIRILQEVYENA